MHLRAPSGVRQRERLDRFFSPYLNALKMSNSKSKKEKPAHTVKKVITSKQDEVCIQLKAETPKVRYLKLKSLHRESNSKLLHKPTSKAVPELRLCGIWLEKVGFFPNDYVSVTAMDGLLLIRSAEKQAVR